MTERENLSEAIKLTAFGYLLLHLNINLGTLNILPDWLGYVLMLNALPAIAGEEPSALLLRPLGILLALWEGLVWGLAIFGGVVGLPVVRLIATALALYFHFQLLTNLAGIAEQYGCPERRRILTLRTVRTLLITLLALPFAWERYPALTVCIAVVHLVAAFWICGALFSLRRSLTADAERSGEEPV